MRLLFKQRLFSWLDSYDIYNEIGETVYTVKGQIALGHCLKIFDAYGNEAGMVKEKIFTLLPKYEMYRDGAYVGCINKEFTLFKPKFNIDYYGWRVEGNYFEWDYSIYDGYGQRTATVSKQIFNLTDTYVIDVYNPDDALSVLMLVIAIDAEKCSRN